MFLINITDKIRDKMLLVVDASLKKKSVSTKHTTSIISEEKCDCTFTPTTAQFTSTTQTNNKQSLAWVSLQQKQRIHHPNPRPRFIILILVRIQQLNNLPAIAHNPLIIPQLHQTLGPVHQIVDDLLARVVLVLQQVIEDVEGPCPVAFPQIFLGLRFHCMDAGMELRLDWVLGDCAGDYKLARFTFSEFRLICC